MSKDANGPTNGGSKFKVVGGTVIADEKEKTYKIPPEESMSISLHSAILLRYFYFTERYTIYFFCHIVLALLV